MEYDSKSSGAFEMTSTVTQQLYDANSQSIDTLVNIVARTKLKQDSRVTSFEVSSQYSSMRVKPNCSHTKNCHSYD